MSELYSNAEDCASLAAKLKKELGKKINFYGFINTPLPSGKYLSSYRINNGEQMYNGRCLSFYFKYSENEFLRISVGSNRFGSPLGEKLAALSDFYEILSNEYGEPNVFYTTKEDDEGLITLQWSFINKEEEIAKFKSGKYFDDAEVNKLIIFGEKKDTEENNLSDKVKQIISKRVGLPFELLYLVDEDFIKYKTGEDWSLLSVDNTKTLKLNN